MNVFANRVEIYQNGNLTQTLPMQEPYKNSDQRMYIGNFGAWRNYFGQIAEVAISRKLPSNKEVHDKWMMIEKAVRP